jgi:hypothetical protein
MDFDRQSDATRKAIRILTAFPPVDYFLRATSRDQSCFQYAARFLRKEVDLRNRSGNEKIDMEGMPRWAVLQKESELGWEFWLE